MYGGLEEQPWAKANMDNFYKSVQYIVQCNILYNFYKSLQFLVIVQFVMRHGPLNLNQHQFKCVHDALETKSILECSHLKTP